MAVLEFFAVEPITLMVSSRCQDRVTYQGVLQELSVVRQAIKAELEAIRTPFNPHPRSRGKSLPHCRDTGQITGILICQFVGSSGLGKVLPMPTASRQFGSFGPRSCPPTIREASVTDTLSNLAGGPSSVDQLLQVMLPGRPNSAFPKARQNSQNRVQFHLVAAPVQRCEAFSQFPA